VPAWGTGCRRYVMVWSPRARVVAPTRLPGLDRSGILSEVETHYQYQEARLILCICKAVTDRDVDAAVRAGARSVDAIGACCGAGTDCGSCREAIEERIETSCAGCPRRGADDCRSQSSALASAAC